MSSRNFSHLVRFTDAEGKIWYGEAEGQVLTKEGLVGTSVPVYRGEHPWDADFVKTSDVREIAEVCMRCLDGVQFD
jgi:hypothetical protein